MYTFGCNDEGALGRLTSDEDECMVPGRVDMTEHIVQISAGDSHTAFLTDDGRVFACGTFRVSAHLPFELCRDTASDNVRQLDFGANKVIDVIVTAL